MNWKDLIKKIVTVIVVYLVTGLIIRQMIINESPNGLIVFFELMIIPFMAIVMNRICGDRGLKEALKNALLACVVMLIYTRIFPSPLDAYRSDYGDYISGEDSYYQESSVAVNNQGTGQSTGQNISQSTNQGTVDDQYVSDYQDGFTYSLSDVKSLDGRYCLNLSKGTLTLIHEEIEYDYYWQEMAYLDGKKLDQYMRYGYSDFMPTVIDRTNGEKLILVGDAWAKRSETRKTEMEFYGLSLWGYANPYMLPFDTKLSEIEAVFGKDISALNGDFDAINQVLADTSIKLHSFAGIPPYIFEVEWECKDPFFISTKYGETFTYGTFIGTEYVEQNVAMITPIYLRKMHEDPTVVPIEKTKEGYMIVDISSLEKGYWLLDGIYPILIK